jgi:hypothetical protein
MAQASITTTTFEAKALRQISRARLSIKQAHHFDNDEVSIFAPHRADAARSPPPSPVIHRSG